MTERQGGKQRRRARILGSGAIVTLENETDASRMRVRVLSREGRMVEVEPVPGCGIDPHWSVGGRFQVRVARPFGLFVFHAQVSDGGEAARCVLELDSAPPRRRQLTDGRHDRIPTLFPARRSSPAQWRPRVLTRFR